MGELACTGSAEAIPLSRTRRLEVGILLEVRRVCELLGVRYFLAYGTLWGAVVERGFLRDDDDIDLLVPRSDYELLLRRFNDLCSPRYRLLSLDSCASYYYPFAKVTDTRTSLTERGLPGIAELGVNVDLFPLDGMPRGSLGFAVHSLRLRLLHNARYLVLVLAAGGTRDGRSRPLGALTLRLVRFLAKRFDHSSGAYALGMSRCVSLSVGGRIAREVFEQTVRVEFEGHAFPAPIGYDRYLSRLYGDYVSIAAQLSPEPAHGFRASWRRRPLVASRPDSHDFADDPDDERIRLRDR